MALASSVTSAILPPISSLIFLGLASTMRGVNFSRYYWHIAGFACGIGGMVLSQKAKDELADYQSSKVTRDEIFDIRLRGKVQNELININVPYIAPATPTYQVIDANEYIYPELPQAQVIQQNSIYYNWDNLPDDAVGIILVGNSGSGKTSSACKVADTKSGYKNIRIS